MADYTAQCFDWDFSPDDLIPYLIQLERNVSAQTDPIQRSLEILLSEVSRNSSRYITDSNLQPSNCVGKIQQDGEHKIIAMLQSEFNDICKKNGLQPKFVLRNLRERQILDCERDRLSKRVRLRHNLPEQVCYVIKIFDPKTEPRKDLFENE